MQPSGQAWAQVLQPVQRSSNQSRFVRARGEIGRVTSGNWMVAGGLTIRWMVTAMPLRTPMPYISSPPDLDSATGFGQFDCNSFHLWDNGGYRALRCTRYMTGMLQVANFTIGPDVARRYFRV